LHNLIFIQNYNFIFACANGRKLKTCRINIFPAG